MESRSPGLSVRGAFPSVMHEPAPLSGLGLARPHIHRGHLAGASSAEPSLPFVSSALAALAIHGLVGITGLEPVIPEGVGFTVRCDSRYAISPCWTGAESKPRRRDVHRHPSGCEAHRHRAAYASRREMVLPAFLYPLWSYQWVLRPFRPVSRFIVSLLARGLQG